MSKRGSKSALLMSGGFDLPPSTSEKRKRKQEWQRRMQGHCDRWLTLLEKNAAEATRLRSQIQDLQTRMERPDSHTAYRKYEKWIDQKVEKTLSIHRKSLETEEKLRSVSRKIGRRRPPRTGKYISEINAAKNFVKRLKLPPPYVRTTRSYTEEPSPFAETLRNALDPGSKNGR